VAAKRLKVTRENKPSFEGKRLSLPHRFRPDPTFPGKHLDKLAELERA
jgi:hypothetical protein